MPYKIAGIDVHKKKLAVVVTGVEVEEEYQFERRWYGSNPEQLQLLAEWLREQQVEGSSHGIHRAILETGLETAMRRFAHSVPIILCLAAVVGCNKESQPRTENRSPRTSEAASPPATAVNEVPRTGVVINGRELSPQQMVFLTSTYRYAPPRGRYWYDTASGAWGVEGRETYGFILPGYDLGPLAANASAGNTGVFINGREINTAEALGLQRTFGAVYQGHWWLDGRTGNFGLEGNPMPMGNLIEMLRTKGRGAGGDNFWSTSTAMGNSSGGCSYVNVGNGQTATSGCD